MTRKQASRCGIRSNSLSFRIGAPIKLFNRDPHPALLPLLIIDVAVGLHDWSCSVIEQLCGLPCLNLRSPEMSVPFCGSGPVLEWGWI